MHDKIDFAKPRGILISEEMMEDNLTIKFVDRPEMLLKDLYRVLYEAL